MVTLQNLPSELVRHIAQKCGQSDMSRLLRVSKNLRNIVTPELYEHNVRNQYSSAMFWAAQSGNIDTLELLDTAGADWNDQSASFSDEKVREQFCPYLPGQHSRNMYFSPLHIAAKFGQGRAVRWLLKHGARINATALNLCSCQHGISPLGKGRGDADDCLYDYNREFDPRTSPLCTPLHIAVCNRQGRTARSLLDLGADVEACQDSHSDEVTSILHTAVRCNDGTMIGFIVEQGFVPINLVNDAGETALQCAVLHKNDLSAFLHLLSLGANPDIGTGAFQYACDVQNFKAANILLQRGIQNFGSPNLWPLHRATAPMGHFAIPHWEPVPDLEGWENDRELFILALASGLPELGNFGINDQDFRGRSPLLRAATYPATTRTIRLLINLGADVNQQDRSGVNPIQEILAKGDFGTTATIALLLRRGARLDLRSDHDNLIQRYGVGGYCALDTALLVTDGETNNPVLYTIIQHASSRNFAEHSLSAIVARLYAQGRHRHCRVVMLNRFPGTRLDINPRWLLSWLQESVQKRSLSHIRFYLDRFPNELTTHDALPLVLTTYCRRFQDGKSSDLGVSENNIIETLSTRPDFGIGTQERGCSSLLHLACKYHHPSIATQLLELGSQVNFSDEDFYTPLLYAVGNCCSRTVKILLSYGANPFQHPSDEPQRAQSLQRRPRRIVLGPQDPRTEESAFKYAIKWRSRDIDRHFFRTSCDIEPRYTTITKIILDYCGLPPVSVDRALPSYVHRAIKFPEALRDLLEAGADPDARDTGERPSPLLYASLYLEPSEEVLESISLLVSHGADVHARLFPGADSFLTLVEESQRAVADGNRDHANEQARDSDKYRKQCALTRLFEIKVDPISGHSTVQLRSANGDGLSPEENAPDRLEGGRGGPPDGAGRSRGTQ
ncbi:hypothetical protein N0V93_003722 [Gnomoniopsis smithogilvyi]|uniref:F-box domain-containing protein n=1 Tax=Gnomoniopsis smithogilvyi TaxID=1191159 RepID=A0A9W8YX69_9PEZI|nr:hypothetical protein N0V93_003722 [Gnomoniopsis smithogilvyi]